MTQNSQCGCVLGCSLKKTSVIFKVSPLEFVNEFENEFLINTVNFGIKFAFSEGPGSAFSEGRGLYSGPIYYFYHKQRI